MISFKTNCFYSAYKCFHTMNNYQINIIKLVVDTCDNIRLAVV